MMSNIELYRKSPKVWYLLPFEFPFPFIYASIFQYRGVWVSRWLSRIFSARSGGVRYGQSGLCYAINTVNCSTLHSTLRLVLLNWRLNKRFFCFKNLWYLSNFYNTINVYFFVFSFGIQFCRQPPCLNQLNILEDIKVNS